MALALNEIQNYLRGLSTTPTALATMDDIANYNRTLALQEKAIEQEAARTFRNQNFQRSLQQEQIAGYGKNQRDLYSERQKAEDEQNKFRREAAEKSFGAVNESLSQVDEQLAQATTELEQERFQRLRKMAEQSVVVQLPKGEKLDTAGNPEHAALLAQEMIKLDKDTLPNLTLAAKVSGLRNQRDMLTRSSSQLLDEAVRYGADVSKLIAPRGGSVLGPPMGQAGDGSLPIPEKAKGKVSGSGTSETPAEFQSPKPAGYVRGDLEDLVDKAKNVFSTIGRETERDIIRPAAVAAGNFLTGRFGGVPVQPGAIYTPGELSARAAAQNRARENMRLMDMQNGMFNPLAALAPAPVPVQPGFGPIPQPVMDTLETPEEIQLKMINMLRPVTNALRY